MDNYWKYVSPRRALSEFWSLINGWRSIQIVPLFIAVSIPALMIGAFIWNDTQKGEAPVTQQIIYVKNWRADRSLEDIYRSQWEHQCAKDAKQAKIRNAYRSLGRATGVDIAEAEAEEKRRIAARDEQRKTQPGYEFAPCRVE